MNWAALGSSALLATVFGSAFVWTVRAIIRDEIGKLNGTYVRANGSLLTGHEIERRLLTLERNRRAAMN